MSSVRDFVVSTYENPPFFSSPKPFCAEGWGIPNEISQRRIGLSRQAVGSDPTRAIGYSLLLENRCVTAASADFGRCDAPSCLKLEALVQWGCSIFKVLARGRCDLRGLDFILARDLFNENLKKILY